MSELRKGHVLEGGGIVQCILRTKCNRNQASMVLVKNNSKKNLLITPYHPIKSSGVWKFPTTLGDILTINCTYVYSVLLIDSKAAVVPKIVVNEIECATLGHGLDDNDVIRHSFFGTESVVKELQNLKRWNDGMITMEEDCLIRDENTGLVIGFNPSKEIF
jgi:hypothetical protein